MGVGVFPDQGGLPGVTTLVSIPTPDYPGNNNENLRYLNIIQSPSFHSTRSQYETVATNYKSLKQVECIDIVGATVNIQRIYNIYQQLY